MNAIGRLIIFATLFVSGVQLSATTPGSFLDDAPKGNGSVKRQVVTYADLFSKEHPAAPVDDTDGFGLPTDAAAPSEEFEGTLTLIDPTTTGDYRIIKRGRAIEPDSDYDVSADSPWVHVPDFSFQFVQSGSHLIPSKQGLVITGSPAWNYIIGPGRVWRESSDKGYMRASFPFALVERNQNCVHNGEMTFLFSRFKTPNVSNVRYQVTQETCIFFKLDMWGQVAASYKPDKVANAKALKSKAETELANRLPTKPLDALLQEYPKSDFDVTEFTKSFKSPSDITTYGMLLNGVNYVSGCPTRHGNYAFCSDMRLPSYSVAKSSFAGMALMWLGQKYGSGVYSELIKNYVPEYVKGGDWSQVTFGNASDMATGNFISTAFEADEDGPKGRAFIAAEPYAQKIEAAIAPFPHSAPPGTKWIYQTFTTFILTQAMDGYLQKKQGSGADIFNAYRDEVFKPLQMSQGSFTTLRTDNSENGRPFGGYGLFFIKDDVAKIGRFVNNDSGKIKGKQILDPERLQETLFRSAEPSKVGVPIEDWRKVPVRNTYRYHNQFWAKHITPAEFPEYKCDFWVPFMSGFGGITVALFPNGVTYYIFSDGNEFIWFPAMHEINKIVPLCR
jgi:hypothetical protein